MGYTTDFNGSFFLDKPLTQEHKDYLNAFAGSRRMKRDPRIAESLPDPVRLSTNLPIGDDGGYYVGSANQNFGQDKDDSVVDHNDPPIGQPGLWCQWVPNEEGNAILWDDGEKFYNYVEWIEYLIEHFLKPWGYTLDGLVEWYGEDRDDFGIIDITDNVVQTKIGRR